MVALHRHSDQEKRKLLDPGKHLALSLVFISAEALPDEMDVSLVQIIGCNEVHLEGKSLEEICLTLEDLLLGEGSVGDLVRDDF